jgi:hypothetical protein
MSRKLFWPVLLIGAALIVAPLTISLPTNATGGQRMLNGFEPIMQPTQVQISADYYNKVFTPLRSVVPTIDKVAAEAPKLAPTLAAAMHMSPTQVNQFLGKQFPGMSALLQGLPQTVPLFDRVPAGLDHYKPLVSTMQANVTNFKQVNSLPDFRWFTWFFVIPGVLLMLIAFYGLGAFQAIRFPTVSHHHRPAASH